MNIWTATKADTSSFNGIDVLDGSRQGMLHSYVYRLRFDLVSSFLYGADEDLDMSDEEREEFLRLAKAKRGISRTVLLPGEMTLHAMHYMILRLFGWQNEHLHRFAIPKDVFDGLTGGKTRWKTCSIPSLSRRISIPYSRGSGYATFSPVLPELTMG